LLIDSFNLLLNGYNNEDNVNDDGTNGFGSDSSIKLAIVGPDDGYLSTLEEKIKEYGIGENVIITGPLYNEEKQEALVDCDLFVMPSKYESFTTSGLEAMACGNPLVLTKNNHIHDWVNGTVGLSCDDDADSLKTAICDVLFDDELSRKFGENGKKLIQEKYNWNMINKQILDIYERFI